MKRIAAPAMAPKTRNAALIRSPSGAEPEPPRKRSSPRTSGRPRLRKALAASDGEHTWWLAADGYGAQAVRMGPAADWPLDTLSALAKTAADGTVAVGKNVRKFDELETARTAAWHAGIVAVTLRTSYQVALLRCPPP